MSRLYKYKAEFSEIVSLCSPQRTHNGSLLIPFLKRSFFTGSFSCRILQEKWKRLGILFIFHNFFHTWWLLSCVELCEPSASRLVFKKWYELFTEKVADREAPYTNSSCHWEKEFDNWRIYWASKERKFSLIKGAFQHRISWWMRPKRKSFVNGAFDLCWVFVLAALLLKQISLVCKLEPMFQHMFRHLCKMLDTMFQHPGTVQCAWVHAYLYACPLLFKETIFPYLIDQATRISLQESVAEYF